MGERRVGARFFGVGARVLLAPLGYVLRRSLRRSWHVLYAGDENPDWEKRRRWEPIILLRLGRGSALRKRRPGQGSRLRRMLSENSTLINSVLLLKFAGLRGVVSHSRSVRRCASRRCSLEQSG